MKIASVTVVRNECDIIEEFVRYNLNFFDEMHIVNHLSTDSTLNILLKLKNEGLPIKLYEYDSYRKDQHLIFTRVQDIIRKENNTDFIMFIDSDEFISAKSKAEVEETLNKEEAVYYKIDMVEYFYKNRDLQNQNLYHQKLCYRNKYAPFVKVMINVKALGDKTIHVAQGAHSIKIEDPSYFKSIHIDKFHLAHFAVRSREQMISKYVIGALAYMHVERNYLEGYKYGHHISSIYKSIINEEKIYSYDIPIISQQEIDNNKYIFNQLPLTCELKYSDNISVEPLENIIAYFKGYIKYNNDEYSRKDLINFLDNINKEDKDKAILNVVKKLEVYICENINKELEPGQLRIL